ncbi:MAG: bifunctional metallophosphatase/5'-nucleotidase, partial [Acidimicrobiia bacterium]
MTRKVLAAFTLLLSAVAGFVPLASASDDCVHDKTGSECVYVETKVPKTDLTLTVLHNNDGESQLVNAGDGLEAFGGVHRFGQVVTQQKVAAGRGNQTEYIFVSSGDNFLASPEFQASINDGVFYDANALGALDYDAIQIGNHDFDFGPQLLADFINSYRVRERTPYLASNLDFSGEPALQEL